MRNEKETTCSAKLAIGNEYQMLEKKKDETFTIEPSIYHQRQEREPPQRLMNACGKKKMMHMATSIKKFQILKRVKILFV